MRRTYGLIALISLVVAIPAALLAKSKLTSSCDHSSVACSTEKGSCEPGIGKTAAPAGKLTGRFDSMMSGVCRFSCAAKVAHDPEDVFPQPGVQADQLTQCPVSGVVFAAEDWRPRVKIAKDVYVTCCDKCATKLKRNTKRYLRA